MEATTVISSTDRRDAQVSSAVRGLKLTIQHLRGVAEHTCSGSVARRCLRLAQLVDEVLIPAVTALVEKPATKPRPAPVPPYSEACPLQTELFELEEAQHCLQESAR
ncbi:MAG: hypothetical protein ABSF66_06555 [Terriglobales bacterium]|jgi:hypothetical protein